MSARHWSNRVSLHKSTAAAVVAVSILCGHALADNPPVTVTIDADAKRHSINPLIYGVAWASKSDLIALNAPLNRMGGNAMTSYNWAQNATNLAEDWYFESYPGKGDKPGADADAFLGKTRAANARAMITVPLIGWVAKLGSNRSILPSFSVNKYGVQCGTDPWFPDAGNGLKPDCQTPIEGNDPNDAYVPDNPELEQKWIKHLVRKWGAAANGGVPYYLMDNEASIWFATHRDAKPIGPHAKEYRDKVIAESAKIKSLDPDAKIVAPEEWGWSGFFYSGYDQQYAAEHGWTEFPDHDGPQKGMDYIPWLLKEWKKSGHVIDVLGVHFYPQGGEFSDDASQAMQLLRNRSTRQLWDSNYKAESWINDKVYLIPRLKQWIADNYYAGTPAALTEYNWGAEADINGATTQADIYGIFGREGLDLATRWTTPDSSTPTFKAMQLYRNYDGAGSTFGDTSVSANNSEDPDNLSAFAAQRTSDGALTVMVVAKVLNGNTPVKVKVLNFVQSGKAKRYQLTPANKIRHLSDIAWSGGELNDTVPAQSITLYVLPD